jgi:hypothetical protein
LTGIQRSRDRWRGFVQGLMSLQLDPLADHSIHEYVKHIAHAASIEARSVKRGREELDEDDLVIRHTESEPTA